MRSSKVTNAERYKWDSCLTHIVIDAGDKKELKVSRLHAPVRLLTDALRSR
jgi:hypothetical protein